jgi:hypothetical protein
MKIEHKVSLSLEPIKGYEHSLDPHLQTLEANQCTELLVEHFLEHIPTEAILDILKIWTTKLRKGATITVIGTSLSAVSNAILHKTLKIPEANKILYGHGLRGCYELSDVSEILKHLGLKVIRKSLNNYDYTIAAKREQ